MPVKSCSDLLLIKSDIYSLEHGQLVLNEARMFDSTPVIKLGDHFKKVGYSHVTVRNLWLTVGAMVDCQLPETIQDDPKDFGTGPLDGHG